MVGSNQNIVDIYFGTGDVNDLQGVNGSTGNGTMDGSFSHGTGKSLLDAFSSTIIELLAEINCLIADTIQTAMACLVNGGDWEASKKLTYSLEDLNENTDLNKEINATEDESGINISESEEPDGTTTTTGTISNTTTTTEATGQTSDNGETLAEITIEKQRDNRKGVKETVYSKSTEIPVMVADIYSLSSNKLEIFDINFFDTKSKNKNKYWKVVRDLVSTISHIGLYISAALILSMIIIRGILLVTASYGGDPEGAKEAKQIIDKVFVAVCMVVGVFVIMTLNIYLFEEALKVLTSGSDSKYIIRANVKEVYSFNTNLTGIVKYKTLTSNLYSFFSNSILYLVVAIFNLLWFFAMILRSIAIGSLIIIAPLTAVAYMNQTSPGRGFGIIGFVDFRSWLKLFMSLVWIPMLMVLITRIALLTL